MDLLAIDTCVPAVTARGAIVEKGQERRKAIGDYLNNPLNSPILAMTQNQCGSGLARESSMSFSKSVECQTVFASKPAPTFGSRADQDFLAVPAALTPRWRRASNRQTPVATETLRLLTLPAIGKRTR